MASAKAASHLANILDKTLHEFGEKCCACEGQKSSTLKKTTMASELAAAIVEGTATLASIRTAILVSVMI